MAEQRMKVRDKKVQKMTKDGLVEENLTDKSSVRVSNRVGDVQMGRKQGEKEENGGKKKKPWWISPPASLNGVGKIFDPLCKNPEMHRN